MNTIRILVAVMLMPALAGPALAAAKQVAIVPFKINADKDVTYLRDGIYDMLSSRLYKEGDVEVIGRAQVEKVIASVSGGFSEAKARDVGKLMGADYLMFGSLTLLGNSISVDAKVLDVSGTRPPLSFFEQSEDAGGIVTRVNRMAADINEKLFGRAPAAHAAAPAAAPETGAAGAAAPPADPTLHPEKMFKQQAGFGEARESPFAREEASGRELSPAIWRSMSFSQVFNGISLGDVDRDGKIETVIVTPQSVMIFRYDQQRFFKVGEIENTGVNVGVDVADINANGTPEIFVTSMAPTRKVMASFVLEWDGKSFRRIAEGQNWFYRVISTPDRGKILLGQELRYEAPFSGRISEMAWRADQYLPEAEMVPPNRDVNVLGLTLIGMLEGQRETVVALNSMDRIKIFEAGKELWTSSERYGGTTLYYSGKVDDIGGTPPPIYLTTRLLTFPGKQDKPRVLTLKNHDVMGALQFERFRSYSDSQIVAMYWDGLGLTQDWRTRKISGNLRDFAVGDFNNDGRDEIVAALVIEEGRVIGTTPKCAVIALELK